MQVQHTITGGDVEHAGNLVGVDGVLAEGRQEPVAEQGHESLRREDLAQIQVHRGLWQMRDALPRARRRFFLPPLEHVEEQALDLVAALDRKREDRRERALGFREHDLVREHDGLHETPERQTGRVGFDGLLECVGQRLGQAQTPDPLFFDVL